MGVLCGSAQIVLGYGAAWKSVKMQTDIIGTSVGLIGIFIGFFISYYFYRKSLRQKEPLWAIRSNNIIKDSRQVIENLTVLYNNVSVDNLTISMLILWNDGDETINRQDIETINKLRINCTGESQILDARVIASNNSSSQFNVIKPESCKCAYISFEYLDKSQGAVIQVVHTGLSSDALVVVGDIKGVKKIRNVSEIPKLSNSFGFNKTITYTRIGSSLIFGGLALMAIGIKTIIYQSSMLELQASNASYRLSLWFALTISFGFGFIFFYIGFKITEGKTPKGLEVFYDDYKGEP